MLVHSALSCLPKQAHTADQSLQGSTSLLALLNIGNSGGDRQQLLAHVPVHLPQAGAPCRPAPAG